MKFEDFMLEEVDTLFEEFNEGDHVHKQDREGNPTLFGVVHKVGKTQAKVKWDNGEESTHDHHGFDKASPKKYGPRPIRQVKIGNEKATGAEYRAHVGSKVSDEAHSKNYTSAGGGYWKDSSGKVVAKSENGKLVDMMHLHTGREEQLLKKSPEEGAEAHKGHMWAGANHRSAAARHKSVADAIDDPVMKKHHSDRAAEHEARSEAHHKVEKEHHHGDYGHHMDRRINNPHNLNSTRLESVHAQHNAEADEHEEAAAHHETLASVPGDNAGRHKETAKAHRDLVQKHRDIAKALEPVIKLRKEMGIKD